MCVYVFERQAKIFHFVPCMPLLIMSMKILFIEVIPSRRKSFRFTTHFHISRGIKLLCWWFTQTHTQSSIDGKRKENLDKLTQIYARRIKLNFIKCDYIKTFFLALPSILERETFLCIFFMLVYLIFLYRLQRKTWYFFSVAGEKGHEPTSDRFLNY